MVSLSQPGYFQYNFAEAQKLCQISAKGAVDFSQSIKLMNNVINDPEFPNYNSFIVDLRLIDYHPSNEEFKILSDHLKGMRKDLKDAQIALVCNQKMYSLGHLTSILVSFARIKMKTFMEVEDAEKWLKVAVDK
ncbi:MAG TPA: hypothetical protein VKA27_09075 [Sunxiuqinia sp.]|nr:hypothetical protein [Sunxiuqinia sp.]